MRTNLQTFILLLFLIASTQYDPIQTKWLSHAFYRPEDLSGKNGVYYIDVVWRGIEAPLMTTSRKDSLTYKILNIIQPINSLDSIDISYFDWTSSPEMNAVMASKKARIIKVLSDSLISNKEYPSRFTFFYRAVSNSDEKVDLEEGVVLPKKPIILTSVRTLKIQLYPPS